MRKPSPVQPMYSFQPHRGLPAIKDWHEVLVLLLTVSAVHVISCHVMLDRLLIAHPRHRSLFMLIATLAYSLNVDLRFSWSSKCYGVLHLSVCLLLTGLQKIIWCLAAKSRKLLQPQVIRQRPDIAAVLQLGLLHCCTLPKALQTEPWFVEAWRISRINLSFLYSSQAFMLCIGKWLAAVQTSELVTCFKLPKPGTQCQ